MEQKRNHDALLVTLADRNFIDQAKQLFSSVYWNAGWKGDYMLLAHEIPEKDLKWFRDKGILVKKCKPITDLTMYNRPPTVYDKFYLFTPEFKKWENIVYIDADIIVRASLDRLAKLRGFWAVRDFGEPKLINQVLKKGVKKICNEGYSPNRPAFNSGVMAFSTEIIKKDTLQDMIRIFRRDIQISLYADQLILNLYFYKRWKKLPLGYNVLNHIFKYYYYKLHEVDAICIHFVTQTYPYHRAWDEKNYFYPEWKNNLDKAELIDLSRIPEGKRWSSFKISRNSIKIHFSHILNPSWRKGSVLKNFLKFKLYPPIKNILVFKIYNAIKSFIHYQIIARLKVIPSRILGLIGKIVKKISPDLYHSLKRKNGTKKKS
jgi:lipopolysaccharide biosynthesis glycosyltransferase